MYLSAGFDTIYLSLVSLQKISQLQPKITKHTKKQETEYTVNRESKQH